MSSTELFKKHFGEQSASVDLKHPNMEKFFSELNEECLSEDKQKQSEQLSCGRNITTCVFYKDGGKCSNLEYCRDQTT